jgi:hypothetical protein
MNIYKSLKEKQQTIDKRQILQNLMSSLSLEQQMQIRKNKYWERYRTTEKGIDWRIEIVKQYKEVLNKRPEI